MRVESNLAIKQSYVAVFSSNSFEMQFPKKKRRHNSGPQWRDWKCVTSFISGET